MPGHFLAVLEAVPTPVPTPTPTPAPAAPMAAPTRGERPTGVSILALLWMVGGVLFFLGSLFLIGGGAFLASFVPFAGPLAGAFLSLLGVVFLVLSVLYIAMGYGQWNGASWAWTGSLVLAALGLLLSLLSLPGGILGLVINGFLLWYFTQAGVKRWFGRAA